MDPFSTPQRGQVSDVTQWQVFTKADVISFIKSIDFPNISVPRKYSSSYDENSMAPFIDSFFTALSKAIHKSSPPKASPKKLLSKFHLFGDQTPTKESFNPHQASPVFSLAGRRIPETERSFQSFPSTPSETETPSPSLPITPTEIELSIESIPSTTSRSELSPQSMPTTLYVDNLDPNVTESDIYELFGRDGGVVFVRVSGDRTANSETNHAQVHFRDRQSGMLPFRTR